MSDHPRIMQDASNAHNGVGTCLKRRIYKRGNVRSNTRVFDIRDILLCILQRTAVIGQTVHATYVDIYGVLFSSPKFHSRYDFLQAGFAIVVIIGRRCARI